MLMYFAAGMHIFFAVQITDKTTTRKGKKRARS